MGSNEGEQVETGQRGVEGGALFVSKVPTGNDQILIEVPGHPDINNGFFCFVLGFFCGLN